MTYRAAKFHPASHGTAEERRQEVMIGCRFAPSRVFSACQSACQSSVSAKARPRIYHKLLHTSRVWFNVPCLELRIHTRVSTLLSHPDTKHRSHRTIAHIHIRHHVALLQLSTRRAQARHGTRNRTAGPIASSNRPSPAHRTITILDTTAISIECGTNKRNDRTARPRFLRRTSPPHTTLSYDAIEYTE